MRLRYSLGIYVLMAAAIPFPDVLATNGGIRNWHNLVFMFGHAGILHYLLNGLAWLLLWKVVTVTRTFAAWVFAVLCAAIIPLSEPTIGWSPIIYYYLGLCLAHMPRTGRWKLILLTLAGFFMPHIAAGMHLALLAAGWLMRKLEIAWGKTR